VSPTSHLCACSRTFSPPSPPSRAAFRAPSRGRGRKDGWRAEGREGPSGRANCLRQHGQGLPPRGGWKERIKGSRPARMPVYGAGVKTPRPHREGERMAPVSRATGSRQFPLRPYIWELPHGGGFPRPGAGPPVHAGGPASTRQNEGARHRIAAAESSGAARVGSGNCGAADGGRPSCGSRAGRCKKQRESRGAPSDLARNGAAAEARNESAEGAAHLCHDYDATARASAGVAECRVVGAGDVVAGKSWLRGGISPDAAGGQ